MAVHAAADLRSAKFLLKMTAGEEGEDCAFNFDSLLPCLLPSPPPSQFHKPLPKTHLVFTLRSSLGHSQDTFVSCVFICAYVCI